MPYNVAASAFPSHDYGLWIDAYTGCVGFALPNGNMCSTVCLSTKGTGPFQCVKTIVDGIWELELGCHSVVNTDNNRIGVCSQHATFDFPTSWPPRIQPMLCGEGPVI
jgi:hypothetical protein